MFRNNLQLIIITYVVSLYFVSMGNKEIQCWAGAIGGCSSSQSKEHIVSRKLLEDNLSLESLVMVYGIGSNGTKKIGVSSLSSKILCAHHNNQLSVLDSEAVKAFRGIRELSEVVYKKKHVGDKKTHTLEINGLLLERWFLKTAINILYCPPHNIKNPPKELLEIVFGLRKNPPNVGLCIAAHEGGQFLNTDFDIKFAPLFSENHEYEIVLFEFASWKFALPLTTSPIPHSISLDTRNDYVPFDKFLHDVSISTFIYHLKEIGFRVGDKHSSSILFSW